MKIFKKIGDALKKTRESFSKKIDQILSGGELDEDFFDDLCDVLISCDIGVKTSMFLVEEVRLYARKNKIRSSEDVKNALRYIINKEFENLPQIDFQFPAMITVIGVNGVGKTTTIGKMAKFFKETNKDVTLVAGDTFRAAASTQLEQWAKRTKTRIIKHTEGADASAVVFDGISSAKAKKTDVLIIDTAGRLHTKINLMEELRKIDKIQKREYPEVNKYTFIVLDATTGQNALNQISAFNEFMKIDGIILTKLDGTAKGGVVVTIKKDYNLPVVFVGIGEGENDLEFFNSKEFVENLF